MRGHLFVALVIVTLAGMGGPAAAVAAPSGELGQASGRQDTPSTLVIDRTVDVPKRASSKLWVGVVVGVAGVVGLVLSRALTAPGGDRRADRRPTA